MTDALLEVDDLTVHYRTQGEDIRAITDASFTIGQTEYFGLAGESGSGKSTIAKTLLGIEDENAEIVSGQIRYRGEEIQDFSEAKLNKKLRWQEIAMIPQASMNSLDPLMRLSEQAVNFASTHTNWGRERTLEKLRDMFDIVGLSRQRIDDYPHQLSGGMQQRVIVAFSLLLEPSLLIADEPTTALDVIMQDQIFKYMDKIKHEMGVSMLLITHDISIIFENCDSVAILHAGQISEVGSAKDVFTNPKHPYSILLQESFPDIRHPDRELAGIEGHPPQLREDVEYCTFVDRCPWATEECRRKAPPLEQVSSNNSHMVSCFRHEDITPDIKREQDHLRQKNETKEIGYND